MTSAPGKINHVGLPVPDIEALLRKTASLYGGFDRGPLILNERQKVREIYMTDGSTSVELLKPLGEGSPSRHSSRGIQLVALSTSRSKSLT